MLKSDVFGDLAACLDGRGPWQEFVEGDLVMHIDAWQSLEEMCEVEIRYELVLFGGLDDAIEDGAGFCAAGRVGEEPVLAADDEGLDAALGAIVVDLQPPVAEECDEFGPLTQTVCDGLSGLAFGKRPVCLGLEP